MSTPKAEDKFFDPRHCSYKLTRKTIGQITKLIKTKDVDCDTIKWLKNFREDYDSKDTFNYQSLTDLHKYLQRADPDYQDPFYVFLESCECFEDEPRANKSLNDKLKYAHWKLSHQLYDQMTAPVDRLVEAKVERQQEFGPRLLTYDQNSTDTLSTSSEFRKLYGSAVAVFNSFMVYLCTFVFFYKAVEYSLPTPNIIAQVVSGLIASTIVGVAELYFLFRVV